MLILTRVSCYILGISSYYDPSIDGSFFSMKTLETMTKKEKSLLLYLETRAVDYSGRVDSKYMNDEDFTLAKSWNEEGFIQFGRVSAEYNITQGMYWCKLSEEAWKLASDERRNRAEGGWKSRWWKTTEEQREMT